MQQIIKLKISAFDLESRNLTWILLKKEVQVTQYPKLNDVIKIQTYPTGFQKILAFRDFRCFDAQGTSLATGFSCWGLMDLKSKKLVRFPDDILSVAVPDIQFLDPPKFKLNDFEVTKAAMTYQVNQFDVDWNGHMNNTAISKLIVASKGDTQISKFQIHFKGEAKINDKLEIYLNEQENQVYFKVLNTSQNRLVALAKASFDI